jgi:predicted NBD/HSP70 family sugar kinase
LFDGELHRGANDVAGELAHVSVRDDGQLCRCGNRGCLATLYRTPQLIDEIRTAYGEPTTFADVETLAQHGDVGVCRILTDLGRTVGRPLADFALLLNPDAIVIDGALGAAAAPVVAGVREVIDRYTPPDGQPSPQRFARRTQRGRAATRRRRARPPAPRRRTARASVARRNPGGRWATRARAAVIPRSRTVRSPLGSPGT